MPSRYPPTPATLEALAASLDNLPLDVVRRVAAFLVERIEPFREVVDLALELLGGVIPSWPLLADWNEWCVANGASFFVWQPRREGLDERQRTEALLHTMLMIARKERGVAQYRRSRVPEVEVAMAGDDCVVCDEHRHHVVPLSAITVMEELPPFHPGCRCGILPRLD